MKYFISFIILIMSIPVTAESFTDLEKTDSPKVYNFEGKLVIPRPYQIYSDSSEYLRENKKYSLFIGAGMIGTWINLGYFLDPNKLIEVSYISQQDILSGKSKLYNLGMTDFYGNSEYYSIRLAYRIGKEINYKNSIIGNEILTETKDIGIDVGIGRRWNTNNYIIGCEWASFYIPLELLGKKHFEVQVRFMMLHLGFMI